MLFPGPVGTEHGDQFPLVQAEVHVLLDDPLPEPDRNVLEPDARLPAFCFHLC